MYNPLTATRQYDALELEDGSRYEVGGTFRGMKILAIEQHGIGGRTFIVLPNREHHVPLADIKYWVTIEEAI
jgi:hypothetical protein